MPSVWLLVTLLPLSLALVCPTFTCDNLSSGVCAVKDTEATARLSNNPCPSGQFCSGQRLYEDWWWDSGTPVSSSYLCLNEGTSKHTSALDKQPYAQWPCFAREPRKDLDSGRHPKDCQSDNDCLLKDGTLTSCVCGFRQNGLVNTTMGICQPDISDTMFYVYWAKCSASAEDLIDLDLGFYYKVLHETYAIVNSDPLPCASTVLWEFALLRSSVVTADLGGKALALALAFFFSLS